MHSGGCACQPKILFLSGRRLRSRVRQGTGCASDEYARPANGFPVGGVFPCPGVYLKRTVVSDSFGDDTQWARAHFLFELSATWAKMAIDLDHVRQIAERVTASQGLDLVDVEFRGGGKARMLRLYIDKPGGVTHEDCAWVSREVGTILDMEDAVPGGSYTLEVSSPGLDRKLMKAADFQRFAGSRVRILTREPVDGSRHLEGRLQGLREGRVAVEVGGKKIPLHMVEIDVSNIERANLVPEF